MATLYEQGYALMENQGQMFNPDKKYHRRRISRLTTSTKESLEKSKRSSEYSRSDSLMKQVYTITCALIDISNTLVDNKFLMEMQRNVNVSHILLINTSQRYIRIGPEELATHWKIGLNIANKTVEVTTQRVI